MTFFRTQSADRDVNELLDPGFQFSHAWSGGGEHTRQGVSVCDTLEELAFYLAMPHAAGIPWRDGGWVIVEVDGPLADSPPCDADLGESLVLPTEVVSVAPVDDAFIAMVDAVVAEMDIYVVGPEFDDDNE